MDLHKAMLLKAQEERDGLHFQLQVGGAARSIICHLFYFFCFFLFFFFFFLICNLYHVITFYVTLGVFSKVFPCQLWIINVQELIRLTIGVFMSAFIFCLTRLISHRC